MAENSKEPEVDVTAVVTEFKLELRIEEFASVYCSRLLSINVLPFGFVFQISFLYVGLANRMLVIARLSRLLFLSSLMEVNFVEEIVINL